MAYLVEVNTNLPCYLTAHHTFGRSEQSVKTLIANAEVSRIHAIIEWDSGKWVIRDVSKNGTWLNAQRLAENRPHLLNIGDTIYFTGAKQYCFTVANLDPPASILVACDDSLNPTSEIALVEHYSILPSKKQPELAVFFDDRLGCWMQETLTGNHVEPSVLEDQDTCQFSNKTWRFLRHQEETLTVRACATSLDPGTLKYIFKLSRDEERTKVELVVPNKVIDLKYRAHHYLTLNLARQRAQDALQGYERDEQGWIYTDQFCKTLGLDIMHMNIQVHRARKQFTDEMEYLVTPDFLIERQPGRIRFGGKSFEIYKGEDLVQAM